MILSNMKSTAEDYLGHKVTHAVVTVPAYFNDAQRQATKDAGKLANLEILGVINEPTAASLAYGLGTSRGNGKDGEESRVLVYDLGGGTFDVSLLEIQDGVFEVLATSGDTHLGGEDFDKRVFDHLLQQFEKENDLKLSRSEIGKSYGRLKREVERAKRTLSSAMSSKVEVEGFHKGLDLSETLTRAKFGEYISHFQVSCFGLFLEFSSLGFFPFPSYRGNQQRSLQTYSESSQPGSQRLKSQEIRHRRDRSGRRLYSYPKDPRTSQRILRRQRAFQRYQP